MAGPAWYIRKAMLNNEGQSVGVAGLRILKPARTVTPTRGLSCFWSETEEAEAGVGVAERGCRRVQGEATAWTGSEQRRQRHGPSCPHFDASAFPASETRRRQSGLSLRRIVHDSDACLISNMSAPTPPTERKVA